MGRRSTRKKFKCDFKVNGNKILREKEQGTYSENRALLVTQRSNFYMFRYRKYEIV